MFTGLIREIGTVKALVRTGGVTRVDVSGPRTAAGAGVGDSIAIDGICLTVTRLNSRGFSVEAVSETIRLTTLKTWRSGRRVHLEPALRAGDPLDGHLVQGHVDGVGEVARVKRVGGGLLVTVNLAREMARFLTPKGSVAIDGVSLTVDEGPFDGSFTVNMIPHTIESTTFTGVRRGRKVNLEMDVLVKAARSGDLSALPHLDQKKQPGDRAPLTMDRLLARGFGRVRSRGGS
jgi:riboflavin synthase